MLKSDENNAERRDGRCDKHCFEKEVEIIIEISSIHIMNK